MHKLFFFFTTVKYNDLMTKLMTTKIKKTKKNNCACVHLMMKKYTVMLRTNINTVYLLYRCVLVLFFFYFPCWPFPVFVYLASSNMRLSICPIYHHHQGLKILQSKQWIDFFVPFYKNPYIAFYFVWNEINKKKKTNANTFLSLFVLNAHFLSF